VTSPPLCSTQTLRNSPASTLYPNEVRQPDHPQARLAHRSGSAVRGPVIGTLNFKIAKDFRFHKRFCLQPNFQMFNVLNTSGAVATNYRTGPTTFGVASNIVSPRVVRIGVLFTF
jgi:hypothetical protein